MRTPGILSLLCVLIAGCAHPIERVRTVDDRPGLSVVGAPPGAILYVDGVEIGPAADFDGKPEMVPGPGPTGRKSRRKVPGRVLLLEPGTHHVEIRDGKTVLRAVDIFLGEGTRREIKVFGGHQ